MKRLAKKKTYKLTVENKSIGTFSEVSRRKDVVEMKSGRSRLAVRPTGRGKCEIVAGSPGLLLKIMGIVPTLVLVVAVLACSVVVADEPDWMDSVVKACKESATMKRAQLDSQLTYLKKLKGKGTYKNVAEKNRAITGVEAQLAYPDGDLIEFTELPTEKLEVGQIGYADNKELMVVQVLDKNSALVEAFRLRPSAAVDRQGRFYKEAKLIWLEADTEKWTNGAKVSFRDPIAITGTKQYRTEAGSNTVLHARALAGDVLVKIRGRVTYGDKRKDTP